MGHRFTPEEAQRANETRKRNQAAKKAAEAMGHTTNGAGTKTAADAMAEELRKGPPVEEVAPPDRDSWRDHLAGEPVDASIKGKARALTTQLSWMVRGLFNFLAMGLGTHWRLSTNEERDLTQAVYACILAQPKHRQVRLFTSIMAWTPNLFLAATVITILMPRVIMTQHILRGRAAGVQAPLRRTPPTQPSPGPSPSPTRPVDGPIDTAPPASDIQDEMSGDEAAA